MLKKGFAFVLTLALIAAVVACGGDGDRETDRSDLESVPQDSLVITLQGQAGQTVFGLTAESHHLDYAESSAGILVKGIDGIHASRTHAWLYSVNDTMGRVAADKYTTGNSDIVKWHYRKL